jgi:glycosyltransferase involved in cell wall biosynthesis
MNQNIIINNVSLKRKRIEFAKQILGPIFFDFCHRLHLHFLAYDNRYTSFLFCTRAGLRLKYLYELFLKVQKCEIPKNPYHVFWISRYMTAKGIYQRNPDAAFKVIAGEFNHTITKKMLPCLLPTYEWEALGKNYDFGKEFSQQILNEQPNEQIVRQVFGAYSPFGNALRNHYNQQAKLFEQQLRNLMKGNNTAILVDSGWQATTQRLLMEGYPEIDWQGLYFGRMGSSQKNNWHFFNVIGLMFESYEYLPLQPETCVHYYHHIVEDLLEPPLPSVEYLRLDPETNLIQPPKDYKNADYWSPTTREDQYKGVLEYFQNCQPSQSLLEIQQKSREAWISLDKKVRFPSPEDVDILEVRSRSADFGKDERNPVVLRRSRGMMERDSEIRQRHALWKQGQIALEFPTKYEQKQKDFAKNNESNSLNANYLPEPNVDLPTVAVITRTKNRPVMLNRAAKSVASQAFQDLVWVVVNDGGDPEEVERIVEQSPADLRKVIIVHNPESLGMEAASNRAIANSKSKYLIIHDDDDSWQPQFLARTVEFLENPPVSSMRGVIAHAKRISEVIVDDEYVEILDSCPYQEWVMTVPLYEMASMNMFAPISFLFAREVYDEIGGFDEQLPVLGDWDFNIRFLMKYDIGVIPEQLANYHHRDYLKSGSYSNSLQGAISKHQMYEAIVRNQGLRQITAEGGMSVASILSLGRATYDIRGMVQELLKVSQS